MKNEEQANNSMTEETIKNDRLSVCFSPDLHKNILVAANQTTQKKQAFDSHSNSISSIRTKYTNTKQFFTPIRFSQVGKQIHAFAEKDVFYVK